MSLSTLLKEEALYHYLLDHSLKQTPLQEEMLKKASVLAHSNMTTAPEQIQFLALLIQMMQAKKVIEVGVFRGVGTLGMALALPDDGELLACDITEKHLKDFKKYWVLSKVDHKIRLKIASAKDTLESLCHSRLGDFDLIYIDADKAQYPTYYELGFKLLRRKGVMVFDNMLFKGEVINSSNQSSDLLAIRELNSWIPKDDRVVASLLPVGDGIYVVLKK